MDNISTAYAQTETSEFVISHSKRHAFANLFKAGKTPVVCSPLSEQHRPKECLMSLNNDA